MILDSYKLSSLTLQINFESAFDVWDHAGAIARELSDIWGGLKISEGLPNQQTLNGNGVVVGTGIEQCTVNVKMSRLANNSYLSSLKRSFDVWRRELRLQAVKRVSARSLYMRDFESIREANEHVRGMGLTYWPSDKVFDQSPLSDRSGIDVSYRFQDEASFSVLRIYAQQALFHAELDQDFISEPIEVKKNRAIVDFDRGTLGSVDAGKVRIDDWMDGYFHVLRRDIDKVLRTR